MLRIYTAPNGTTWQYEEGEQPEGFEPADAAQKKAAPKRRPATANKAKSAPANKGA